MAKKAVKGTPKKKAPRAVKKSAPKKTATRGGRASKPGTARKPRNQSLPGMEHVRYADLDAICESIADARHDKNRATTEENEAIADAIPAMQQHGVMGYKHAGIGLTLTPGRAKLAVKVLKDKEAEGADLPGGDVEATQDAPELDPDAGDVLD